MNAIQQLAIYIFILLYFVQSSLYAQGNREERKCLAASEENNRQLQCISIEQLSGALDLTAPTNTLYTLIGATPETIITPKSGDEFAFSFLPQAVDAFGNDQFAIGLELNPGLMRLPERVEISDVFSNSISENGRRFARARQLSRFSFTSAVSRTPSTGNGTQFGLGLSFTHDSKSALNNGEEFFECVDESKKSIDRTGLEFQNAITLIRKALNGTKIDNQEKNNIITAILTGDKGLTENQIRIMLSQRGIVEDVITGIIPELVTANGSINAATIKAFGKIHSNCIQRVSRWNRSALSLGFAGYYTDVESVSGDADSTDETMVKTSAGSTGGAGGWFSYAFPFGKAESSDSQIILHARSTQNLLRAVSSGDGEIIEEIDLTSVGLRYTRQFSATLNQMDANARATRGFLEVSFSREDSSVSGDDDFLQFGIGAEFKIRRGIFFQFVFGDTVGSNVDRAPNLSGQFKWSISDSSVE